MTFALIALIAAASADSGAAQPSAQALEVARASMPRTTWDGFRDQAAPALGAQLEKETAANGLALKQSGQETVVRLWDGALPYEEFLRFYAVSLATGLSEKELAEVAAFHRSPAGRKFAAAQRKLELDAQAWIRERLPRLGKALNEQRGVLLGPARAPEPRR